MPPIPDEELSVREVREMLGEQRLQRVEQHLGGMGALTTPVLDPTPARLHDLRRSMLS